MITINSPSIRELPDSVRLESIISVGSEEFTAYFEVGYDYGAYLCQDRCDPFLVAFFLHALILGEDIHVKGGISEMLFYQVDFLLLDFLRAIYSEKSFRKISITADSFAAPVAAKGAVGTGVSCGIDSLAAIFRHYKHQCPTMRLTHLCFFDTGSHGRLDNRNSESMFEARRKLAQDFSGEIGLPLVEVRSNLSEVIPHAFGLTHTYLDAAAALSLQGLFSTYYYASGAPVSRFLITNEDPAYFDAYLLPMLSTRGLRFYSSEENFGRFEKTRIVSENPLSYEFLNVCNATAENCGNCNKCIRTQLALDALGTLSHFSRVFDLQMYKLKRSAHLSYHMKCYYKGDTAHLDLHPHVTNIVKLRNKIHGIFLLFREKAGNVKRRLLARARA